MSQELLDQLKKEKQEGEFLYPYYGARSLAEVPSTVLSVFGADSGRTALPAEFWKRQSQGCSKVILFLVDGLGYHQFSRYAKRYPFFKRIEEQGDVFPITSVFPACPMGRARQSP